MSALGAPNVVPPFAVKISEPALLTGWKYSAQFCLRKVDIRIPFVSACVKANVESAPWQLNIIDAGVVVFHAGHAIPFCLIRVRIAGDHLAGSVPKQVLANANLRTRRECVAHIEAKSGALDAVLRKP